MDSTTTDPLARLAATVRRLKATRPLVRVGGTIVLATPTHYRAAGLSSDVLLGDCVEAESAGRTVLGQVIRIEPDAITIKFFEDNVAIPLGAPVLKRGALDIAPGPSWKGRIIDALARPIDGKGRLPDGEPSAELEGRAPPPLAREPVGRPLSTGIRVIDLFTPLCEGQRMGVFAGSGVGKSTLLGMLARGPQVDTSVVVLVGERGREVREFVDEILADALARSVVVVASGDESAMMRRQAPRTGMRIAEALRDAGESVLLIVDSITRYAHALREVALATGEPPVARGYPPSVLSDLPRLLERAGPGVGGAGAITAVLSVLVDGDDHNDPISDAARGILDGHIVLDRAIAARGRYPAVDILGSVSRLADKVWRGEQRALVQRLKGSIAEFEETRDLRLMGAYKPGVSAELDKAVRLTPQLYGWLSQRSVEGREDVFAAIAQRLAAWG